MTVPARFVVGVDRDFLDPDGKITYDIGIDLLDETPNVDWRMLPEHGPELTPANVEGFDAVLLLRSAVSEATLAGVDRLALLSRFGVGYERVDVAACTRAGVLLATAVDAVRTPVATGVLALMLALGLNVLTKDRIARESRWGDRHADIGTGIPEGAILGVVGMGNIGRETLRLCAPLGLRYLVSDPAIDAEAAARNDAELVELDDLMRRSDFISINTPLTDGTHHLIDARRIALMKPTARLINTARGPVVDQEALYEALRDGRIAGAGLDVFDPEPLPPGHPLFALDNVVLAPHTIALTHDSSVRIGRSACRNVLAAAAGQPPEFVVNREAVELPAVQAKLARFAAEAA